MVEITGLDLNAEHAAGLVLPTVCRSLGPASTWGPCLKTGRCP